MLENTNNTNEQTTAVPEDNSTLTEVVDVRFRRAGKVYYFDPKHLKLSPEQKVIVETTRGIEIGDVTAANHNVKEQEITPPLRSVIRLATDADLQHDEENRQKEKEAFDICKKKIESFGLEMSLIEAEYTFDNNKLLFYFTADGRVDFRELVKELASVFRTRIELRQIGIRDEAKLLGGLGVCGRPFCCKTFLSDFAQVSIKMAKEQNFSLNSAKISGACGRLMCCMRFEHETYEEEIRKTPSVGSVVSTPSGEGVVCDNNPLAATVTVNINDKHDGPRIFPRNDVKVIMSPKAAKKAREENETETETETEN